MPASHRRRSPSSVTRERRGEVAGRALVAAWQASGLPQAAFARRRGISAQRLSYWRLRTDFRGAVVANSAAGFIEIPRPEPAAVRGGSVVVVEMNAGVLVRVFPGFDPALLRAVVSALTIPVPAC